MASKHRAAVRLASAASLLVLAVASCGGRLPARLPLDANPVFTGGIGWIVVSEAYARVKAEPEAAARDIGHLRGGDILAVLGRERKPDGEGVWYRVDVGGLAGWLQGGQAVFFDSRDTAERAAGQYR